MESSPPSSDPFLSPWARAFEYLSDPVLVVDRDRNLRFVNPPARQLLGYGEGEELGGRCRLLTRGLDCEATCPVTFALQQGLETVEDFEALYRTRDGGGVRVRVTAVLLRDGEGGLLGHVEILRPLEPEPGFYLAGRSPQAVELRRLATEVARSGRHLLVVGERPSCADVARAVHRFSGLSPDLFHHRSRDSGAELPPPPATLFLEDNDWAGAMAAAPPGVRVIAAVHRPGRVDLELAVEVLELPPTVDRREDLPLILAAWVDHLSPGLEVSPAAMERLCATALERGLTGVEGVLTLGASVAAGRLEEEHLPRASSCSDLLAELLGERDPLAALEERLLREVLGRCAWRMQEAADRLGISRVTLWRKLREHGIER